MENLLVILLIAAVGYIIYLEQQPKTDKERRRNEEMRERTVRAKAIQAAKDVNRTKK